MAAGELEFIKAELPASTKPRRPEAAKEAMRQRLQQELETPRETLIPGIKALAREMGVSEGFIRYHLPDLMREYLLRHKKQCVSRMRKGMTAMLKALRGGVLEEYLTHKITSQDAVVDLLVATCPSSKRAARNLLAKELRRLADPRRADE